MCLSLYWQHIRASYLYNNSFAKLQSIPASCQYDLVNSLVVEDYQLTTCHYNCALFMSTTYTIFPLLYYLRVLKILNLESYVTIQG